MSITPPAVRKGLAIMLTVAGLAMTPTATAADATGSEKIVNGDFEYPAWTMLTGQTHDDWTAVERHSGQTYDVTNQRWDPIGGGFDPARFGWDSTETDGPSTGSPNQRRANEVEIQHDPKANNTYAEIVASQAGTAIYQDINTTPGAVYTVSLKHASLNDRYADSMRVIMVAKDGTRTVLPMTRMTTNKAGDKVGETGDTITTHATNNGGTTVDRYRDHAGQWATYTGTYIATTTLTRFTFESVASRQADMGNLVDDISFKTAYPLTYDGNGSTAGTLPRQTNQ